MIVTVAELGLSSTAWSEVFSHTVKTSLTSKTESPDTEMLEHNVVVEAGIVSSAIIGV